MKLQAPKMITFWIAVILAILGFLGKLVPTLPLIGPFAFWFVLGGFVLLVLGLLVSGL